MALNESAAPSGCVMETRSGSTSLVVHLSSVSHDTAQEANTAHSTVLRTYLELKICEPTAAVSVMQPIASLGSEVEEFGWG